MELRTQDTPMPRPVDPTLTDGVPLTELRQGQVARLVGAHLDGQDGLLLSALGLTDRCRLRLCKHGDPWIVQVRTTRIGLADSIARRLVVLPEAN